MQNLNLKNDITISCLFTKEDYCNIKVDFGMLAVTKANRIIAKIVAISAALLTVLQSVISNAKGLTLWISCAFLISVALVALFYFEKVYPYILFVSGKNQFDSISRNFSSQIVTINDYGVYYKTTRMAANYPWEVLYSIKLTEKNLIIYRGINSTIIIPTRAFTNTELNELKLHVSSLK